MHIVHGLDPVSAVAGLVALHYPSLMNWTPLSRSWNPFTVAALKTHWRPVQDAARLTARALERWENEGGMIPQLRPAPVPVHRGEASGLRLNREIDELPDFVGSSAGTAGFGSSREHRRATRFG